MNKANITMTTIEVHVYTRQERQLSPWTHKTGVKLNQWIHKTRETIQSKDTHGKGDNSADGYTRQGRPLNPWTYKTGNTILLKKI